jgi:glyoxylase-like metal-dependent hydrolase (beta-lactamase superfamily II)
MTGVSVRLDVLDTGYCSTRASLVARGTGWSTIRCHAPAFLLTHPQRGAMLFDTGYAPRITDAFRQWPARAYSYATPTIVGQSAHEQLVARGVSANAVSTIIVSHLHADHVAGLRDFPAATIVLSQEALALQQQVHGVGAVRRGIVPALFPPDFAARVQVIPSYSDVQIPELGAANDLCGDGCILLMPLPGHARGQIGALVRTTRGRVLLCADGAWSSRAYREQRAPHWLTAVLQDDLHALQATLRALLQFSRVAPDVTLLPTHCPETLQWGADT